jgi:NAD(P)-dependent dehydrogenase (short-subunit alcohol dehydrogenase family)
MSYADLKERVAIVTGAGRGIGLAISKRLASAQASVAMIDVDERNLQEAARESNFPFIEGGNRWERE